MKIAAAIAQYLMGLAFVVFGLNMFLDFIPSGPRPTGPAGAFFEVMFSTHYMRAVGVVMLVSGILFLLNRFVALGLTLLGPVLVNILLFHLFMQPRGIWMGVLVSLLWVLMAWRHRAAFAGTFQAKLQE
jgi:hypothetical protein